MIKKYEIGGARRTYGGEEWCVLGFGGETEGKRDPVAHERIILKWISGIGMGA